MGWSKSITKTTGSATSSIDRSLERHRGLFDCLGAARQLKGHTIPVFNAGRAALVIASVSEAIQGTTPRYDEGWIASLTLAIVDVHKFADRVTLPLEGLGDARQQL